MVNYIKKQSTDVKIHDESKVYKGYTLYAMAYDSNAWLVDMEGKIVHFWEMKNIPANNYKLLKNSNLMWMGKGPGSIEELNGSATELVEVDWDGNEVWKYDDPMLNHDFEVLPDGNIIVLRFVIIPKEIEKNIKGGVPGTELNGKVYGLQLREINRKKETVWEWNNFEHFDFEKDQDCDLCDRNIWGYTNSVDVFPNGDPIISVRRMNKVIRISRKTGKIIWEWGPEHLLGHQHDVSVTKEGTITIFDNGLHRRIYKPGIDPNDTACFCTSRLLEVDIETNEIVWEYIDPTHNFYSNFMGSVQKLPNNNYLACESRTSTFYEITKDKKIVWKYEAPFIIPRPKIWGWSIDKQIFQAHRYGEDYVGLKGRNLDPEKYEWIIRTKSAETLEEEKIIKNRLSLAGY